MKKLRFNYYLAVLGVASMGFFAACGEKEEDPAPRNTDPGINTYTAVLLGNQNNTSDPSFYSTSTNTRYNLANAKSSAAQVDFGFGTGAAGGNEFFVGSPDDPSILAVYPDINNWSTANSTRFKIASLTSAQFDTLSKESALITAVAAGTDPFISSRVRGTEIEPNDIIAFTTDSGQRGLFKVVARSGTSSTSGSITLNVKVEKKD